MGPNQSTYSSTMALSFLDNCSFRDFPWLPLFLFSSSKKAVVVLVAIAGVMIWILSDSLVVCFHETFWDASTLDKGCSSLRDYSLVGEGSRFDTFKEMVRVNIEEYLGPTFFGCTIETLAQNQGSLPIPILFIIIVVECLGGLIKSVYMHKEFHSLLKFI